MEVFGFVVGRLGKNILTLVSLSWWALGDAPVQQDQPRSTGADGFEAVVGQPPPVRRSECDPGLAPARRAGGGYLPVLGALTGVMWTLWCRPQDYLALSTVHTVLYLQYCPR